MSYFSYIGPSTIVQVASDWWLYSYTREGCFLLQYFPVCHFMSRVSYGWNIFVILGCGWDGGRWPFDRRLAVRASNDIWSTLLIFVVSVWCDISLLGGWLPFLRSSLVSSFSLSSLFCSLRSTIFSSSVLTGALHYCQVVVQISEKGQLVAGWGQGAVLRSFWQPCW